MIRGGPKKPRRPASRRARALVSAHYYLRRNEVAFDRLEHSQKEPLFAGEVVIGAPLVPTPATISSIPVALEVILGVALIVRVTTFGGLRRTRCGTALASWRSMVREISGCRIIVLVTRIR